MSDVANSFKKIVSQSQTDSTVQTYSAAEGEMHYYIAKILPMRRKTSNNQAIN